MDDLSLKELLKKTIPYPDRFETYWIGKNKKSFSLFKLCNWYNYTSINDFEYVLADYLNEYPASSIYKERSIRPFIVEWYQNTVDYLGVYDDTETLFPHYVVQDKTIDLLKALHPREGVTKQEISQQLGMNGKNHKSVQTDLRLLSPSLAEGRRSRCSCKGERGTQGREKVLSHAQYRPSADPAFQRFTDLYIAAILGKLV